jgi:hypothetical protein
MWGWRYPIDDLRKEVREAKAQGATSTTFVNLETLLDEITTTYEHLEKEDLESKIKTEESDYESRMKHWERYLAYHYDKASDYNRIVIAGAFVAYFAVWSRVGDLIDKWLYVWSVLFVLASLVIFALWEIGANFVMARHIRDEASLFRKSGKEYMEAKEKADQQERQQKISMTPLWYLVLIITISTGVLGSALLVIGLVMYLAYGVPR